MKVAHRSSTTGLTLVAAAGAMLLVGCSSSPTSQSQGTSPTASNAPNVDVTGARAAVAKGTGVATFKAPGPTFDIKKVTKSVWLIAQDLSLPEPPFVSAAFTQAARQAGVRSHVCPGRGTPDGNALCIDQAIQAGAGSIVIWSVDPKTLAQPLAKARAAGIKVVSGNNAIKLGEALPANVDAEVSHDYFGAGYLDGAYAVSVRGGSLKASCIAIREFIVTQAVCDGFNAAVAKFCASCKAKVSGVAVAQLASQVASAVSKAVLSDSANFIEGAVDDIGPLVFAQLKQLGKTPSQVMFGSENGTVGALQAIRDGTYQVVSAGQNVGWWGWSFFDAGARAQVGAISKAVITTPNTLFTKASFKYSGKLSYADDDAMYGLSNGNVYKQGYASLWKG